LAGRSGCLLWRLLLLLEEPAYGFGQLGDLLVGVLRVFNERGE